ncbi:hypothetical protein SRHO_G00134780 [Serrasalmus rhombeus]
MVPPLRCEVMPIIACKCHNISLSKTEEGMLEFRADAFFVETVKDAVKVDEVRKEKWRHSGTLSVEVKAGGSGPAP